VPERDSHTHGRTGNSDDNGLKKCAEWYANKYRIDACLACTLLKRTITNNNSFEILQSVSDIPFLAGTPDVDTNIDKSIFYNFPKEGRLIVDYLNDHDIPFFSFSKLVKVTSSFLEHIEKNKASLLNCGYPEETFIASPWLGARLSNLYPIQFPPEYMRANHTGDESIIFTDDKIVAKLQSIRAKLFKLKYDIVKTSLKAVKHKNYQNLWNSCLTLLKATFPDNEESVNLIEVDQQLKKSDVTKLPKPFFLGGLSDILYIIGFYLAELSLGTFSKIRRSLTQLFGGQFGQSIFFQEVKNTKLMHGLPYHLLKESEQKERKFWKEYWRLVAQQFLEIQESSLVPIFNTETFSPIVSYYIDLMFALESSIEPLYCSKVIPKGEEQLEFFYNNAFPEFDGLRWEEITITFQQMDMVRIQAREVDKKYTCEAMGFLDHQRGNFPDTRWRLLREFAHHYPVGILIRREASKQDKNIVRSAISTIRKRLKAFFSLSDDPFHSARKYKAYLPKFKVIDETQLQ